ncbi:erythromycin esterase family protein [Nocardia rhizosphaerae]|uniref:Erythromycin esterase family protein n=1 Tax=Nocardia rhizosphaerae TaxID=1691571 RepID=A0ABV8L991_9NOCA
MSSATAPLTPGRPLDDATQLGHALDDLLATRTEPPAVLALGEPTHGIAAFPSLRNDILAHLVERGFRSVVLETDHFAASLVDDYIDGADTDLDTVLATGFTHAFGAVPGNRELVTWLRAHNAGRAPADRVRFHGFDAPLDQIETPSPRAALTGALAALPAALRPASAGELESLLGADADWSNPAGIYDPDAALGDCARVRFLRSIADDIASALRRAAPDLRATAPAAFDRAVADARTAQGVLRYHAAMGSTAPDRIGTLLSIRAEMMADNLLAIRDAEQDRGPSLVFAHNAHVHRGRSTMGMGTGDVSWCGAGALVAPALGARHIVVTTDGAPHSAPGTLQGALAAATTRRSLFSAASLRATLPAGTQAGAPIVPGHIPLTPADLDGTDAVIFVADTDGTRHQYW